MTVFDITAILLGLAALIGYLNFRLFKLPHTIGLMVITLAASFCLLLADARFISEGLNRSVSTPLKIVCTLCAGSLTVSTMYSLNVSPTATTRSVNLTAILSSRIVDVRSGNHLPCSVYMSRTLGIWAQAEATFVQHPECVCTMSHLLSLMNFTSERGYNIDSPGFIGGRR